VEPALIDVSADSDIAGSALDAPTQELPEMYEFIDIDDGNCPPYSLALPAEKRAYYQWIANVKCTPDIAWLVADYLKGGGTLIDVGANVGTICIPAAIMGSHVVAVELVPETVLYLSLSILMNRLENVRVFQMAAGENRRLIDFAGSEGNSCVVETGSGSPSIELPLDDIVDLTELAGKGFVCDPVLIKIDTEGYELHVLSGARRIIEKLNPVFVFESILIEGRNDFADTRTMRVKSFLEEMGYHLYLHRAGRLVPRAASDLQEGHVCDYFASRQKLEIDERIGRFTVSSIDFQESINWLREMIGSPEAPHRMHAAGVLARIMNDWQKVPMLIELARDLMGDQDPAVADFAARRLWVWK
jgi:FkbM family methyltransferase